MSATEYAVRPFQAGDLLAFPDATPYFGYAEHIARTPAFTAFADGRIIACGGIGAVAPGIGEAWLILRQPLEGHGRWLARSVRLALYDLMSASGFSRVQALIRIDRPELARWARFLGLAYRGVDPARPGNYLYAVDRRS